MRVTVSVPENTGDKSLDDTEESEDVYSWIMIGKKAGVLLSSPRYPSCSVSLVALSIEPCRSRI